MLWRQSRDVLGSWAHRGLFVVQNTLYYYYAVVLLLALPYITASNCLSSAENIKYETISNSRKTLKRCNQRPCPVP